MRELTKSEKRIAKDIIRRGILRRHAQWQQELRVLLDKPLPEGSNEFDRSLEITNIARNFYKEAMKMEDYYRNNLMASGLANLYEDNHITDDDIAELPEDIRQTMRLILNLRSE